MVGANVPKAVLSTMKSPYGARVPYAGSPNGKAAAFTRRCLSSLTWGHDGPTMCACECEWIYACGCGWVFFFCDSILLEFWAQSAVHMVLVAPWMAYMSVMVKPIGQDKEGAMIQWEVTFCLLSIWCCWNPGSSFKCLHSWLIKSDELLLLMNWQAQPHMSAYLHPCMNRLHNASAVFVCLNLDFTGILTFKPSRNYLKPMSVFSASLCVFMFCGVCVKRLVHSLLYLHKIGTVVRDSFKKDLMQQMLTFGPTQSPKSLHFP